MDIHTDRRTDTGRDIVASAMKQIATKNVPEPLLKFLTHGYSVGVAVSYS